MTFFDRWAESYDSHRLQDSAYRPVHDELLTRLTHSEPHRILDLGCGTGHLSKLLADTHPASGVVGVDLSAGMLEKAAKRIGVVRTGGVVLARADAQNLPFAPASFDVIACTESFHWYPDQPAVVRALRDLLVPGGRFFVASIAAMTGFGQEALRIASSLTGNPIRALTMDNMAALLATGGLEVVDQKRVPRPRLVPPPGFTEARRPFGNQIGRS